MLKERLKKLREEKSITQRELARLLQISPSTIAMYETEQRVPPVEILERIADFFNVSVDYLLGRTEIRNSVSQTTLLKHIRMIFTRYLMRNL